jgi:hypothetical protein
MSLDSWVRVADFGLAVVLGAAGLTKLSAPQRLARFIQLLGFARTPARLAARWLPIVEMGLAFALFPERTRPAANVCIFALMMCFTVVVMAAFASGGAPLKRVLGCGCFGRSSSGPVGPGVILRNFVLTALAGFALWGGPLSAQPKGRSGCLCALPWEALQACATFVGHESSGVRRE